ncbi:MAG: replication-relaxation family protein [Candidatus Levybacteria bacterium]|nr:replication-relaxation family protein [Candidatus Levybacteria bacterium]
MQKKDITNTQNTILFLLYKFRFLHTHQFQKLLNHKNHTRINTWLTELTEKEYLQRYYDKQTIIKKPAVYTLTKKARKLLKSTNSYSLAILNKIYREKHRSQTFIDHCLLIADVYLTLLSQKKHDETITFETKNTLTDYDYFPQDILDAYIAIKRPQGIKRCFTTIIDPTPRLYIAKGIVRQYFAYCQSSEWEESTDKPFPSMLLICPDEKVKRMLTYYIAKILNEEQADIKFYLSTAEEVQKRGFVNITTAVASLG